MNPAPEPRGKSADYQLKILLVIIFMLLMVILIILVKPPFPKPPVLQRPEMNKHPEVQKLKKTEGKVLSYHFNVHEDVNSIEIKSPGSGIISTDFQPHTAKKIMELAKAGDIVTVQYTLHPTDEIAGYHLQEITNKGTGRHLLLSEIPPPKDIPQQAMENFTLNNPELITDPYGGIVALRKNNLLFHFKPGLVDDIMPLIKASTHFKLTAVRRNDEIGFVNTRHNRVYIVLSLTIDNKTFLVR